MASSSDTALWTIQLVAVTATRRANGLMHVHVEHALRLEKNMDISWYGVSNAADAITVLTEKSVALRYSHRPGYWGLRESPIAVQERCGFFENEVAADTHKLFNFVMSERGLHSAYTGKSGREQLSSFLLC